MPAVSHRTLRYILFIAVVIATLYFFYTIREVVLSFFIAAVVAYIMYRPVLFIEKSGFSRTWAILTLYLLVLGLLILAACLAVPAMIDELSKITKLLPDYAGQAQHMAARIDHMEVPDQVRQIIRENIIKVEDFLYSSLQSFMNSVYKFFNKIITVVFAPILAFYILEDWEKIRDNFLNMLSPPIRRNFQIIALEIDTVLIQFFKGYLLISFLVGVFTGLTAFILGVKFALLIGVVSGVTNLVPYFGPLLGGIPAVALALSESFRLGIYMMVAILVIQQVESNVVTPRIIGDRLGLHPLVIVFALLAGGQLLGIWGMLLAVPVTAVLKVVLNYMFFKMVEG